MTEWQTSGPDDEPLLRGRWLSGDPSVARIAQHLSDRGILEIKELKGGLLLTTTSFVGRVSVGDLEVTVQPKIARNILLPLLRYAYGLRDLSLLTDVTFASQPLGFEELVIEQLIAEVREILSRGLYRRYLRREDRLPTIRGQVDLKKLASGGVAVKGLLPCAFYPRTEDCLENQVLVSGLQLAAAMTSERSRRYRIRAMLSQFAGQVSHIQLSNWVLDRLARERSRLTDSYSPAFALVRMLFEGRGITLDENDKHLRLLGFVFDMNRFFQALISRFLHENLPQVSVEDERTLKGMFRYMAGKNPRNRRAPQPRPDFILLRGHRVAAVLDAKYRDLWETTLPREMLYQLSVYSMSQSDCRTAVILYPTVSAKAKAAVIEIADPVHNTRRAEVVLRPVNLTAMAKLVAIGMDLATAREARAFAAEMSFG